MILSFYELLIQFILKFEAVISITFYTQTQRKYLHVRLCNLIFDSI